MSAVEAALIAQTVCFTGDFTLNQPPISVVMRGILFHAKNLTDKTRAIVLIHGFDSNGTNTFDGGPLRYGVANETTLARALARAGYAVFVIDRLGMGASPYPDGDKLTFRSFVELTGSIVAQIKAGTYHTGTAACPADGPAPFKPHSVVIGGHSFGAAIAQGYFQTGSEADGLISLDIVPMLSPAAFQAYSDCQERAFRDSPAGSYVSVFCTRDYCMQMFYNMPGYDTASAEALCDPAKATLDPRGELGDVPYFYATTPERLLRAGPVLLLYAECPAAFNAMPCDPTLRDAATTSWGDMCPNCMVTSQVLPGVAHFYMYYPAANLEANRVVLDWLATSGLGPTAQ